MRAQLELPQIQMWSRWALVAAALAAIAIVFGSGLVNMQKEWNSGEYSHGYLIPFISIWMLIRKRDDLLRANLEGDWWGLAIIALALAVAIIGELATLYTIIQYAFLLTLIGFVVLMLGWQGLKILWAPLLYLAFMIPLPDFIYRDLSSRLQLLSSVIGVAIIRTLGISVFIEGNIIDLGNYKLQVAEACSGLRYLFPLLSFGFLCAYLFAGQLWQRIVLFLSTIPIAVLMNSLRIAVIGVLTETSGPEAAEGFLHLFEGWVVFVLCLVLLFGEAWLLLRLSGNRTPLADAFGIDLPNARPLLDRIVAWTPAPRFYAGVGLLVLACIAIMIMGARIETVPTRASLVQFPLRMDEWRGQNIRLDAETLHQLRVDDYFNANYVRDDEGDMVNVYIAYYQSQRKGSSVHSPRSCIPAGGWEIESIQNVEIGGVGNSTLKANRVTISRGSLRQVVYYWFDQRGRTLTDEYLVKWYIFHDAIFSNRTDGALIRLVTPLQPWEQEPEADRRLTAMVRVVHPELASYIPK
jgi:exosortase D (VPLPA-CTERM-specific)